MAVRALAACLLILIPTAAAAQEGALTRPAIEAVASVFTSSDHADDPFVFLDLTSTWRVHERVDVLVRPYARRLPGGDWDALLYQAQVRYHPTAGVRLEAGIISSPIGLAALELRPDLNPTVGYPFYYFAPLPPIDEHRNRLQLLSGGYPIGAMASWSGTWLDARAAVTDGTPARYRKTFGDGPGAMPQFIAGGGITPVPGLRVGAALATGRYRNGNEAYFEPFPAEASDEEDGDGYDEDHHGARARVLNIEAEYAVGHTRLSGEWVRDAFETEGATAVAGGFYVQGVQTLTPRTFAAVRLTHARAPLPLVAPAARWEQTVAEVAGGVRLNPAFTLRAGYQASRRGADGPVQHAMLGSLVWARRWF